MSKEEWRPVVGFEGRYEVSNLGRVWSIPRQGTPGGIKVATFVNGYPRVFLLKGKHTGRPFPIHRLVLIAFVGPPGPGQICRHLNGDSTDPRLENLRWGTPKENNADMMRHGTHQYAHRTHCSNGHEYTPENIYYWKRQPTRRQCRTCQKRNDLAYKARKRAAA